MKQILAVGLGGFLGSVMRYGLGKWILKMSAGVFPFHTLIVNILGCFFIGFLAPKLAVQDSVNFPVSEFLLVGLLGGFTTFSAFGYEFLELIKKDEVMKAGYYVLLSVGFGITAVWLGWNLNH